MQIALNVLGVVPEDSGWFAGLHQMFYILLLGVQALAVGMESVGIFFVRKRERSSADKKRPEAYTLRVAF